MTDVRRLARRLQVLEAITDNALRELDLDKLFDVLLQQVRSLFSVDTVTVLLVDSGGGHLVARATTGLEEEVLQGVRIPVGSGFAGAVANCREPVQIDHVDPTTVVNPLLWERGLRVMLGVPMVAEGRLIGVLHIGSTSSRRFTDEDVDLLQLAADRLATAAHLHRSRSELAAAALLQDSLLPALLPTTPAWEFAARYVPGAESGVGGDWYDVFTLPGDRIGVVIGDVVGSGLPAAIVMGRLRSALRAYALEFAEPAEVLGKLDRKASHFEANTMATVAYAVIDTATTRVDLALAGHLPPVLVVPDEPARLVDAPLGPPIGYELAVTGRRSATFDLPPDALLAFYTDGLVERRGVDLDSRLEQLCDAVAAGPADTVCARIMASLVGNQPATDDIALLVTRHRPDLT
ncbi:GAF domain-containing SpoIIE family protein phosphatase [Actinosynnema sp. NPDC047251]|uniref:GAF domain-containing serine/threonine phosphatase n=1 Tax=Saccharothrix espanaensis (strain ATCC 51144 / DSM 44229 / JCM 9112 / NBRC 15066 / NRRL 15764) TaxID=1179773 RepID=K0K2X9_SACES|nr:GAF domain-containing SpoIIE family protein phosphatase [Saccharothrix espanaensis]CCH32646.1 GAF domain-containing serine/threonine phosphatase [Saccharothrix espanaensis DSM 44229]